MRRVVVGVLFVVLVMALLYLASPRVVQVGVGGVGWAYSAYGYQDAR